jgi:hypothetical protein
MPVVVEVTKKVEKIIVTSTVAKGKSKTLRIVK